MLNSSSSSLPKVILALQLQLLSLALLFSALLHLKRKKKLPVVEKCFSGTQVTLLNTRFTTPFHYELGN